jgi:SsrA-binding protein
VPAREDSNEKLICKNRRAFFDYDIQDRFEGGLVLRGSEVKSLREGGGDLVDSYARLENRELWLVGARIAPYAHAAFPHDPQRARKVLVHRSELHRLTVKLQERGFTLVPLRLYFNGKGRVKVELGLGKGKKTHDRRADVKKREVDRELRDATRRKR